MKSQSFSLLAIFILILLFATMSGVYCQSRHLQFTHLTPDEGLSSSVTTSIIQDHRGFIWIGTSDGLNRYDGFKFVVYKNIPGDSSSLAENVIQSLFEDHENNLFIGTENGLSLYNREMDCFHNYMLDKTSPLSGISCIVTKITDDSLGNLWLATSIGLIYFDRTKNQIVNFSHDPDNPQSLSDDNAEDLLTDKYNRLWVATRKGLNLFLPESGTFKHFTVDDIQNQDLSKTIFMNLAEDRDGNIWAGSTEGVYCLKNNPGEISTKIIHYQHDDKDQSSLSSNQVVSLYIDDEGDLWIGTESGGINLFDTENQGFWHYRKDDYDPQSLNNESIETIFQDKTGNMWFGTFTGGLNVAMKNRDAIVKYQNLPGAPLSLSHNTVMCFSEDHQGQIWVGTDGGGLNLFDSKINRFLRFKKDNSRLNSDAILCLTEDSDNIMWAGTWAGGLVRFDSKNKSFTSLTTKNSGIQDNSIYSIAEGNDNDLWLGSFEHGLIHYEISENKFTDYTEQNSDLANKMIVKLKKFSHGRLLIGTVNCFQIFSPDEDRFITYLSDRNNPNSLSYPRVTDILPENDSCVWIGTPDGLNRFNPITGSFKRFYVKDGLPDNFIKGLVLDNSGVLWVTTTIGVCRFDYKKGTFKNFTKEDGIQGNEFSERSVLKTKNGAIMMGGTRGFNIVYPEKIAANKIIPDVLITDLKIFNNKIKPGINSPLTQNITELKSLSLSSKLSVLTFYFAVMDFSAPEKNQYAYKMENFDREWIYSGNKGEAQYTNLSPGEYVFRVKGSNNDGLWNDTGTSLRIIILPPWWNTWWFRVILVFTLISIIASLFFSRVQRLKNQKILLEKLVAIKTHELNELNASKDKFFSIIAHDLKNPFNTIIGFSEMLIEEISSGNRIRIEEYSKAINNSAIQTLRLLENLLEWAKSQTGNILFNPTAIKLIDILNEEFRILNDMAMAKNIKLSSSFPDNLEVRADKDMIKTILRNLISNAIKFTHKNGKVEVNAIIYNKQVEISVSDNGTGMTKETITKLFRIDANFSKNGTENEKGTGLGLILCKEFVEKHGGKIWAESEQGRGSIFKFWLPLDIETT